MQVFTTSRRGATAIEYGLIAGGIGVAVAAAVYLLGENVGQTFEASGSLFGGAGGGTLVYEQGFDAGLGNWKGGKLAEIAGFGSVLQIANTDKGPPPYGSETVSTTFSLPENVANALVSFDMTFADSWDDEFASVFIDGKQVFQGSFDWEEGLGPPPAFALDKVEGVTVSISDPTVSAKTGVSRFIDEGTDYTYNVQIEVADPSTDLRLGFGTNLNSSGEWDESLLVDNVNVVARD